MELSKIKKYSVISQESNNSLAPPKVGWWGIKRKEKRKRINKRKKGPPNSTLFSFSKTTKASLSFFVPPFSKAIFYALMPSASQILTTLLMSSGFHWSRIRLIYKTWWAILMIKTIDRWAMHMDYNIQLQLINK